MKLTGRSALCTCILGYLAVTAASAASAAMKPTATTRLPAVVAADLKSVADQCREAGGKAMTADAIKRADLNGDGQEDFVFDVASINCDGNASVYGDRDKGVTVYVGDSKGGARNAFNGSVYGMTLERSGAAKLWLTVSAELCGKKPAADFASENFCDRALVWNAKSRKFVFAPLATVRMIR